jgi:hypothetical protein
MSYQTQSGGTLSDLANNMQRDPAFQQYMMQAEVDRINRENEEKKRQEELKRQEEENRKKMQQSAYPMPRQVLAAEATAMGEDPNFYKRAMDATYGFNTGGQYTNPAEMFLANPEAFSKLNPGIAARYSEPEGKLSALVEAGRLQPQQAIQLAQLDSGAGVFDLLRRNKYDLEAVRPYIESAGVQKQIFENKEKAQYEGQMAQLKFEKAKREAMGQSKVEKTPEMIGQEEAAKLMARDAALARRASIPGTPEYSRVQKENAQKESVLAANENRKVSINSKLDNLLGPVGEDGKRAGGAFDDAMNKIGFFSTGLTGQVLGLAGGTDAYDLEQALEPIRSNLTVETINEMKKQSPTGATGLGQIAIKELEMLQGAIRSLKKEQSQDQLRKNMAQVRTHLQNWEKTVQQAKSQGVQSQSDIELQAEGGGATQGNKMQLPASVDGWRLMTDKYGNQAYVSPDGSQFRKVR